MCLTHTKLMASPHAGCKQKQTAGQKPGCPVEMWFLHNFNRSLGNLLWIIHLQCCYPELILPRRNVGVIRYTARRRVRPALVEALKHVAKSHSLLGTKLDHAVMYFQLGVVRTQRNRLSGNFTSIRQNLVYHDWR